MFKAMKYLNPKEWLYVAASVVFIVIQVWLDLLLPDYMSAITTLVETEGSQMSDILLQGGYMLLCALGSMAASIVVGYFAARVAAGLAKTLRGKIYDKTLDFSMENVDRFSTASLVNRTTNDITQIQTVVATGLQAIIKAPIMAVWAIVKIAGKNWQWTLATGVAVGILIVVLAITLIFAVPRFKKIQGMTDNLNRITREQLNGIRVVRAYNAEDYQEQKFNVSNEEITETNLIANRVMALMNPTMTLLSSGLTLAVYWIGTYLIAAAEQMDRLSIFSDMVVFSNYAIQVIMAFMLLNMVFILLPRAQVSANRVCEVLDTPDTLADGEGVGEPDEESYTDYQQNSAKGTISFKDVSFRYPDAASDALHNLTFDVQKGETLAIIGSTGSGKTSLINLIPRFYDVKEGQVLVDGKDVREYKQKELRTKIGYVSQKAVMFSGTVQSNIAYGDNGAGNLSDESMKEAISIAQADEFVLNMKDTYQAPIAQGGTNVSGGQKQRLSIARAIARKPEILIFDDSFSALDYKTDRTLRTALNERTAETTKIIVAQRISTIRDADRILVMDHGRIVGNGTHKELMKSCRQYQEIAQSQLSKEELSHEG